MAKSDRTEKATPRRRQKAREKGQVTRTRELPNLLGCTAAIAILTWQASRSLEQWPALMRSTLEMSARQGVEPTTTALMWSGRAVLMWTAPSMIGAWVVSTTASVVQGGLVFAPDALTPSADRINPAAKLQQLFSMTGLSQLLKSLIPFAAMLYLTVGTFYAHWGQSVQASNLDLRGFIVFLLQLVRELGWKLFLVLLTWSGIDYFLMWRKMESDLRMSKQEMREEFKESEGDPTVKGKIRRLQRQMRRAQMMRDTEKAAVVVTNPTHFAVALRYEPEMAAPVVVAKGRDRLAEQIKEVARLHDIPILENPPLAQVLYRAVSIGQEIPAKLYIAVAEILALIYRAQAQARQQAAARVAMTEPRIN